MKHHISIIWSIPPIRDKNEQEHEVLMYMVAFAVFRCKLKKKKLKAKMKRKNIVGTIAGKINNAYNMVRKAKLNN